MDGNTVRTGVVLLRIGAHETLTNQRSQLKGL
jgi:hypothetical protein